MTAETVIDRLRREGKVIDLTDEQMEAIREHMRKSMRGFREDLRRKEAASWADLHKIILNA